MSSLTESLDRLQEKELERDQFYQRCMIKWLQGHSVTAIARSEGSSTIAMVMQAISIKRVELKESQEAEIEELVAERIGGLRHIMKEAYEYLGFIPDKAPQLLSVALRAEETIAKIQGVLSEKVVHLGRIQHDVKYYDFEDSTPDRVVEGSSRLVLDEPKLGDIEETIRVDESKVSDIPILKHPKPIPKPRRTINGVIIETVVGGFIDL